jgi:hypothetical protein
MAVAIGLITFLFEVENRARRYSPLVFSPDLTRLKEPTP